MRGQKKFKLEDLVLKNLAQQEFVNIGPDELCPCGSGKLFSQCCQSLRHRYAVAWENKDGSKACIDATLLSQRVLDLVGYMEKSRKGKMGIKEALTCLSGFYLRYDRLVKVFAPLISCRRYCHWCCHYYAGISLLEAEYIRRYAQENLPVKTRQIILEKIKLQAPHYIRSCQRPSNPRKDAKMMADYFSKRIPCPFLSDHDDCLIYPARPFTCRSHCAVSPPITCKTGKGLELLDVMNLCDHLAGWLQDISLGWLGNGDWEHIGLWFVDGL